MPYDEEEMARLMAGESPYQGGGFGGTGAGASFGESLLPGSAPEDISIEEQLQQPFDPSWEGMNERWKRNVIEPAQAWWEYQPREDKFMDILRTATDLYSPQQGGASQAGMFFGSKAARNEMAKALQTARKMYKPGTPARQGLLKTAERGVALGERPSATWGPSAQGAAGAFDAVAPERMMKEAQQQNLERITKSMAAVKRELDDVALRLRNPKSAASEKMLKARQKTYDEAFESLEGELKKHRVDTKRAATAAARNRARYGQEEATLGRSYVSPWARGGGTEFHEMGVHGMVAGMDPVQRNLVEGVMDQTNVGKWMAKHHGKPIPGQNFNYVFPEGWRDTPEEQLAWVLTEISEGRVPSQEAINTSQLDDLMRVLEGNF